MTFPVFKKALRYVPVIEREIKMEELKFKWKKLKLRLDEGVEQESLKRTLISQKKDLKAQIMYRTALISCPLFKRI